MGKRGTVNLLYSGRASLSLPLLVSMKALYLAQLMSEVLKSHNKQTQGGGSWNVNKPKKNGEDVSMGGPQNAVCIEGNQGVGWGCLPPRVDLRGNWVLLFAAVRLCWSSSHLVICMLSYDWPVVRLISFIHEETGKLFPGWYVSKEFRLFYRWAWSGPMMIDVRWFPDRRRFRSESDQWWEVLFEYQGDLFTATGTQLHPGHDCTCRLAAARFHVRGCRKPITVFINRVIPLNEGFLTLWAGLFDLNHLI